MDDEARRLNFERLHALLEMQFNDPERRAAIERSIAAMQKVDELNETLNRERQERAERGEASWQLPQPPEPASSRPRAPRPEGRNWEAERRWIEGIIDSKLAGAAEEFGAALGETISETRQEIESEFRREIKGAIDAFRVETQHHLDKDVRAALDKLNVLLDRALKTDGALRKLDDLERTGLVN